MGERATSVRRGAAFLARLLLLTLLVGGGLGWTASRPEGAAAADFAIGASVSVSSETLTYRVAPSATAAALLVLTQGTVGTVTAGPVIADGYTWYEFSTPAWTGYPGWVAGEFLTPAGEAPRTGTVAVQLDGLNLRSAPGLAGPIIAALPVGLRLNILGGPLSLDSFDWYEVQTLDGMMRGWVAGLYLTATPAGASYMPGEIVFVAIADLNFRERPALDAPVRATLNYGTIGQVVGGPVSADGQIWYQLAVAGIAGNGWASGTYLTYP